MIYSLLDERQQAELAKRPSRSTSRSASPALGRFRANAFSQRGSLALALRVVPFRVRTLEELGAPTGVSRRC